MTEASYTYSFSCPKCGGSWKFEEFASIAKDVFSSFEGIGVCPLCHVTFSWARPGTLTRSEWWQDKKNYKPHTCVFFKCDRKIEGSARRKYCSKNCRQNDWYHKNKRISTPRNVEKEIMK